MKRTQSATTIVEQVQLGKIIIYPTEAIFGLGCDPANELACQHLLKLKQRNINKGFILIASQLSQIIHWLKPLSTEDYLILTQTKKKPTTWLVKANDCCPYWLKGKHSNLAIRITQHLPVIQLCNLLGHSLVSTSANLSGGHAVTSINQLNKLLIKKIDYCFDAPLGDSKKPSQIIDLSSNNIIRQ